MTNDERDIQRKLRVLQHAEKIGNARKACRYFGIGRSSFYRWRDAYQNYLARAGHPQNTADLVSHSLVGHVDDLIYTPELIYTRKF